jgi:hypothetical protein
MMMFREMMFMPFAEGAWNPCLLMMMMMKFITIIARD